MSVRVWIQVGTDSQGRAVCLGDVVEFDKREWYRQDACIAAWKGEPFDWEAVDHHRITIEIEDECIGPAPGDLRSWCKVVESPGIPASTKIPEEGA
jgi:hypothetical protein